MPRPRLTAGDLGDEVAALHERLAAHGYAIPPEERNRKFFGPATRVALSELQKAHGIDPSCEMCERTAATLAGPPVTGGAAASVSFLPPAVSGTSPSTVATPALPDVRDVSPSPPPSVISRPAPAPGTPSWQPDACPRSGTVAGDETFTVDGKVASRLRAVVCGLRVQIVDKNVGDDIGLAEAFSDDAGAYQATFKLDKLHHRGKQRPDLQARAFAGPTFLGASEVRYNASSHETLNVILTETAASALPSEHATLTRVLSAHFQGNLRDLKETDDRPDITYLANKTGWDARAVALAALADQFSQSTVSELRGGGIKPAFFYALFRAGIPANSDTLYQADAQTAGRIWKQAIEQGVIPKEMGQEVGGAIEAFRRLSAQKLLTGPALAGVSSLKEMLTTSRLDEAQQKKFAELHTLHRTDMPVFWKAVGEAFGEQTTKRLQVDGKLAFLTINNAPLTQKLHQLAGDHGLSDPLQLAQLGYHRAEKWSGLLNDNAPVPKEIPGNTVEAKRGNYADYLAAHVRLSYPTAAVAQMVQSGELPLMGAPQAVSDKVHAFLTEHQGKFEIGMQPVQQYIARNKLQVTEETVTQLKRLQRVYQITPGDQAMTGLMKRGIDAAYHVVRYPKEAFVQAFAQDVGGADKAAQTYDKSVQVHNAVLNIAISYLTARTAPGIGVHSPAQIVNPAPANAGDIIAYATLESLFGSMDFCACDHCRSILSPAAYLVDLLQFLGADDDVWSAFVTNWKSTQGGHGGAPYPFHDLNAWNQFKNAWTSTNPGKPLPNTEISPFQVLMDRRPDVQHLPLTCENTNTALPYIDVVNETLEYFIANSTQQLSLNGYVGHDTNGAASEDLLASPQFVMDSAYTTLQGERFPTPLPFHQPWESLRRYFDKFEIPLPLAMERLRQGDDLERGAKPYGWRDILMEEIGLSRDEYEILTDSNAVPLWRMYGFPNGTTDAHVIPGLSNAKQFARRNGITYEELISILRTRFINPNSDLIPKLERLRVDFAMLAELKAKNDTPTDTKFDALLAALAIPPDPVEYGGAPNAPKNDYTPIRTWVKNDDNYARIMGLITLAIPAGTWSASKVYAIGECVRPSTPQTGSNLYYECTQLGTSAASEPNWPTIPGDKYNDGTVGWTCRNASSCLSFDNLAFRYSDPAKLTQNINAAEFVRLLRFIRLWKKLGWAIEQTDTMVCALYRTDLAPLDAIDINDVAKLNTGFLTLLPRLGIVRRVMKALNLTVKRDLLPLLACWSPLGIRGASALYRQMFLNPALLKQDATFADNGYGEFLQDNTEKVVAHAEALRSAFNLTGDEFDRIVTQLGYDANTPLTISNISAIFRRGWLARRLKISVRELLLLTQLTGLDPFAAIDLTNPAILRIIALVQALKARSLKSAAALYLIWNQDLSGKSAPETAQVAAFAQTLRFGFAAIEMEFAIQDDPEGAIAQTRMTLVYGADAAAFFFGLLNDTLTLEVDFSDPNGTLTPGMVRQAIDSAAGATDAGIPKMGYDDFRKRLSYSGVLTVATRDSIKSAAPVGAAAFKTAMDDLYDKNQAAINPFFARYPELRPLYNTYVASPPSTQVTTKRSTLLNQILPELLKRRKEQQALQAVSSTAQTSVDFAQAILTASSGIHALHAAGHADQPALNDFLALEIPGLSVQFFASDTATGAVIPFADPAANLDYTPMVGGNGNPLPANPTPSAAVSGVWSGYLEAPASGFFNLHVETDLGATVTLQLDGKTIPLTQTTTFWHNTAPIELRAGTLYSIKLTVEKVRNIVLVQWEWEPKGQGREGIPTRYLYPATAFKAYHQAYVRFLKATSLAKNLSLTANEITRFATDADYQIAGDGWLNALPMSGDADAPTAAALLKPLQGLLDFARIKAEISPDDESLLTVLKDPVAATTSADSLLFALTRWDRTSLNELVTHFGGNLAGLTHLDQYQRVYDAFALIQTMGISATALFRATTNEPTGDTLRDLQAALRARYDTSDWRDVVQPINDELRSLQRTALVAYILHQMRSNPASAHIDTADKLFEYFLMDVEMEPCMQTSRIRHALSSVQLFIERCLMNLEPRVSPAAINATQWTWMKRYRVWEANRKVFLWPENWLEPELRDDKSPFFKEIESELLQSDITEDRAATALLNYLSKLEEVAKLEPCGIHHLEDDPSKRTGDIDHVVARTAGAHRKYYYRRYEYGYWTPWEHIKLDIEDNPVIPVVWKDRLFLLWLRILKQTPLDPASQVVSGPTPGGGSEKSIAGTTLSELKTSSKNDAKNNTKVTVQAVLCWSEYYNGKWQPTKTSDINETAILGQFTATVASNLRSGLLLGVTNDWLDPNALRVMVGDPASFLLYNTHSLPVVDNSPDWSQMAQRPRRFLNSQYGTFHVTYYDKGALYPSALRTVLDNKGIARTVQPIHDGLLDLWLAPFFYEDRRHVFYVTTTKAPLSIYDYRGYEIRFNPGVMQVEQIPPLVLQADQVFELRPKFWGDGSPVGPDPGVINPTSMALFLSEDAHIGRAIATQGSVTYGDKQIGPAGAIAHIRAEMQK